MNILAFDLGTDTGYAIGNSKADAPLVGHWSLADKKEITEWGKTRISRRKDPRIFRLFIKAQNLSPSPDLVIFEDVQFSTFTFQTQLWASLRAAIWCAFPSITVECVPVATLKKFATGSGSADKHLMMKSLLRLSKSFNSATLTDDEADAAWLWYWAKKHIIL